MSFPIRAAFFSAADKAAFALIQHRCVILPRMPVTMLDIAKGLNVSVVTVSKVLRNKGKISVATRKRVLQRAKELNYHTNWIARSLVTRRTFTIGLLLPDFTQVPRISALIKVCRSATDNLEIGDSRQVRHDFILDADSEIGILLVIAQILERQHGDALLGDAHRCG